MTDSTRSVAVLVHACDRYELLFAGFAHFFYKHWDVTMPCTFYFASEVKDVNLPGFINVKSGKGEWADRLKRILENSIKEDYVIYLQEDMWFTSAPDPDFFRKLIQLTTANRWKLVKLHSSEVYQTQPTEFALNGLRLSKLDNAGSMFLMSHQVSLWDKNFLAAQLKKGEHPWRNERRGSIRLKHLNQDIFQIDAFSENGKAENNCNESTAIRGSYSSVSVNAMLNERVLPFIDELQRTGDEKLIRYALDLQSHFEKAITHDGLRKPRKQDIFNRIKHWFIR